MIPEPERFIGPESLKNDRIVRWLRRLKPDVQERIINSIADKEMVRMGLSEAERQVVLDIPIEDDLALAQEYDRKGMKTWIRENILRPAVLHIRDFFVTIRPN